ncbi:MAG: hypothetical protein GY697_09585 [Desulfobacterales bacterium]|nr:hypothetical protein [Desulfobacterales bacterium]
MRCLILAISAALLLLSGGCAHRPDYNRLFAQLQRGECRAAVTHLDEKRADYGDTAQLLYLLDSAMVHLQCRDFETAQERFQAAEQMAEALWTESLSRQAASLVTNEYLLKYTGEDYERALINMMAAIGYLQSGQFDDALVECRRLDSLLSLFNEKYEKKNVYKEDALGRYLSGILHEADNALDDAFIDYRKAFQTYQEYAFHYNTPAPPTLIEDLLRVAAAVDRIEDIQALLPDKMNPERFMFEKTRSLGKVVFLQLSGRAPLKTQGHFILPTRNGPISIAYPRLLLLPEACTYHRLTLSSGEDQFATELALAEDIGRIALKNLDDKKARIMAKTLARAVAKQVLIDGLSKNNDKNTERALKTVLNIANLFLEQADTRSWRTLPGKVYMTRVFIPPGAYHVTTTACGNQPHELKNILVEAGKTNYIVYDDRFISAIPDN